MKTIIIALVASLLAACSGQHIDAGTPRTDCMRSPASEACTADENFSAAFGCYFDLESETLSSATCRYGVQVCARYVVGDGTVDKVWDETRCMDAPAAAMAKP